MNGFLRQSTASQSRAIGPFVSDSDFTPATGLTIGASDIKLIANGAASADKNSGGGTHRANGMYGVTFDATDTATVGELSVSVKVAGALVFSATFTVMTPEAYDAQFGSAAPGYAAAADDAVLASIDALPTNAELATALAAADDAVLAAIDNLPTNAELATALGAADDAVLAAIAGVNAKTTNLPSDPADQSLIIAATDAIVAAIAALNNISPAQAQAACSAALVAFGPATPGAAMTLTAPERAAIADRHIGRNINGGADGGRTVGDVYAAGRNKVSINLDGTFNVHEQNDTTVRWTGQATRTPGDPISEIDPA